MIGQDRAHLNSTLFDRELVPVAEAAQVLGIEPKRLIGLMLMNSVGDPIGGQDVDGRVCVYGWSCKGVAAVTDTEVRA